MAPRLTRTIAVVVEIFFEQKNITIPFNNCIDPEINPIENIFLRKEVYDKFIQKNSDGFRQYSNLQLIRTSEDEKVEFNSGDVYLSTDLDYRFVIENEKN